MSAPTPAPDADRMAPEPPARWRVLAGCALVVAFGMPALWGATLGLFLKPIQADLGWTRAEIAFSMTLVMIVGILLVPAAGWLIDRIRLRPLILAGIVLQSLGIATLGLIGGSVWNFYALCLALMVCGTGASMLTLSKIVQGWFDQSLGKALGILFAAGGVGSIVTPLYAQLLMQHFGWRMAYALLALTGFVVAGIAAWWTVRDGPLSKAGAAAGMRPGAAAPVSIQTLLADRNWLVLAVWNVLFGYAAGGVLFHFAPLLLDRGATQAEAAVALSLMGVGGLCGNLAAGWLMDHLSARRLAIALMLVPMCAILILFASTNVLIAMGAAVVFGVCNASEHSLTAFLVGRYFGTAVYGRAYSMVFVAGAIGGGLAPWIVGLMQQREGDYSTSLLVAAGVLVAAAAVIALLPEIRRTEVYGSDRPAPAETSAANP